MSRRTQWATHMVRKMLQAKRYAIDPRSLEVGDDLGFWEGYFACARGTLQDWMLDRHLLDEERRPS